MTKPIILASASPRRQELLKLLDLDFEVIPSKVDEVIDSTMSDGDIVMDLAKQKAQDVAAIYPKKIVLGFDTIVVKDHHILGKPKDDIDAKKMLRVLSNSIHQVLTGVAIYKGGKITTFYETTDVYFKQLTDNEIISYLDTKEPYDKAGAYGIQGKGAKFVTKIVGDYYTVMGVPLHKLYIQLQALSII